MLDALEAGLKAWLWPGLSAVLSVVVTYAIYRAALAIFRHFSKSRAVLRLFVDAGAGALGAVFSLLALTATLASAPSDLPLIAGIQHTTSLLLVLAITWASVRMTSAIGEVIVTLNPVLENEWKRARKVETQTRFLVRALRILIVIIGGLALFGVSKVDLDAIMGRKR